MPATTPEQVNEQLIDALSRGDIDTAIALYEPEASFVSDGKVVSRDRLDPTDAGGLRGGQAALQD